MNAEDRKISLADLLIYVLKGWRWLLAGMLLMGIAAGGIRYLEEIKAVKEYQKIYSAGEVQQQQGKTELGKGQPAPDLKQLREKMSEEEKRAVKKVVRLEKEYAQMEDYMQSSVLMQMDAYRVSTARLQYWVDMDTGKDKGGTAETGMTAGVLVDAYINRIMDSQWRKNVLESVDDSIGLQYLSEMISVTKTDHAFVVYMKYTEQGQLRKIANELKKDLGNYCKELSGSFGTHRLVLVNESVGVVVDNDVYTIQQNRKSALLTLENNIAAYKAAFNDAQKSLYTGKIVVSKTEKTQDNTLEGDEDEEVIESPAPRIRIYNILLGAILGMLLAGIVRASVYVFSDKLKNGDNIEAYPGISGLGYMEEQKTEVSGYFGRLDAKLDRYSRRNCGSLTNEQQIQMIVSNIALCCEKERLKNIYFNSSVNFTGEKTGQIADMLRKRGIAVSNGLSILQDAAAMEDMCRADGVVFFEETGKSRYGNLEWETKLCRMHQKKMIGMVVVIQNG